MNRINATLQMLCEKFPAAFFVYEQRRKPLKIGIHHDIAARLGDEVDPKQLRLMMRQYFVNRFYQAAVKEGAVRIDLVGQPASVITAEEKSSPGRRWPGSGRGAGEPRSAKAGLLRRTPHT